MINLPKIELDLVKSILQKSIPDYTVWLFGSRITHKIKPFSDIDLVIIADKKMDLNVMHALTDAFVESDLPYKVDVVDWSILDDEFKKIIQEK